MAHEEEEVMAHDDLDFDILGVRCGEHPGDDLPCVNCFDAMNTMIMEVIYERHPEGDWPCANCLSMMDEAKREVAEAAEAKEVESGAVEWAKTVKIAAARLPAEVREEADAYYRHARGFDSAPGDQGVLSYIRHNYTNYETLLMALEKRFPATRHGPAYSELRERADEVAQDALDELGARECEEEDGLGSSA